MNHKTLFSILLLCLASTAAAQDTVREQAKQQEQKTERVQQRDQIYGSQLMTEQERNEHRNKLRAAKTEQERKEIQAEHHKLMQERAKAKGITLPDEPRGPAAGAGKCGSGKCGGGKCGSGAGPGGGGGRGR